MKKILFSLLTVAGVATLAFGATQAFFSDTETSTGNILQAGALDLKVDSTAHYAGLVCDNVASTLGPESAFSWQDEPNDTDFGPVLRPELIGTGCDGTWNSKDLDITNQFFNLTDIKPGDTGENTVSLLVVDNDAWGTFTVNPTLDADNDCTEPESESVNDEQCFGTPTDDVSLVDGELGENLTFSIWLDQGTKPGFQGLNDPGEGDNIRQENEPFVITEGTIDPKGENYNLWQGLSVLGLACDEPDLNEDGHTANTTDTCRGLADDGRLVGTVTYYFGIKWSLPTTVGNEVQTDSYVADLIFRAVQHRNNPNPSPLPLTPAVTP